MINPRGLCVLFAASLYAVAMFLSAKDARFTVKVETLIAQMEAVR